MKSLDFQAWLLGWDGYRLRLLANLTEFSVTRNIKDGGGIQVTLDAATASSIPALSLLTVERGWDGAAPSYMDTFVLSNRTRSQAARGTRFVTLQGADIGSWLLGKRGRVAFTHLCLPFHHPGNTTQIISRSHSELKYLFTIPLLVLSKLILMLLESPNMPMSQQFDQAQLSTINTQRPRCSK
jgi:hypothetical protein